MLWYENNARHKIVIIPVIHICTCQKKQKSMLVRSPHICRHALVGERKGIIIPEVTMQVHLGIISFHLPHSGIKLAFNDLYDEAILKNIGQYIETNWYQFRQIMQPEWRMIGINKQLIFPQEVRSWECMYSILDDWSMGPVHGSKIAIRLNSIYQLKGKEGKMTDGNAERWTRSGPW